MSRPWMPLYIGDYRRDTAHLSTLEHGAYFLLIMHYWETGPLPDDDRRLARISGLSLKQWLRVRVTLESLFLIPAANMNGQQMLERMWRHKRIDAEIEKCENISTKRRLAALKSLPLTRGRNNVGRFVVANLQPANAQQKDIQSQSHLESLRGSARKKEG
jgi:uncharacterized protein YdaU (DUF1376 family)